MFCEGIPKVRNVIPDGIPLRTPSADTITELTSRNALKLGDRTYMDKFDKLFAVVENDIQEATNDRYADKSDVQLFILLSIAKDLRRIANSLGAQA